MILIIDNYDSFVHNLARFFRLLGCQTTVVRNDQTDVAGVRRLDPAAIVLSPGPCGPDQAGVCLSLVRELEHVKPILGVCLGHQTIIQALGGRITASNEPMHGRQCRVQHQSTTLFDHINNPFSVGRYHSLVGESVTLPSSLRATAHSDDQTIMAVEHQTQPIVGMQFHPESILTDCGFRLISNFLSRSKIQHTTHLIDQLQAQQRADQPEGSGSHPLSDRLTTRDDR